MELNVTLCQLQDALKNISFCKGDGSFMVRRLSSLQNAGPQDMAIVLDRGDASVFDPISDEAVKKSKAGLFVVSRPLSHDRMHIVVPDTLTAFDEIVALAQALRAEASVPPHIASTATVHASAVISAGTFIGEHARIGAHVFVGSNCHIGNNVVLLPGAKILDDCIIGDATSIDPGAVIGSDGFGYQVSKTGLRKIPQVGIVRIGLGVEIGANCTIDRAAFDETVIGDGVKIDNNVHIAHNVKVGAHTIILALTGIAGSVEIGQGCQIGGQVAIKDHLLIGNGVKIVSKSAVISSVKDGETVAGIPAIPFNQWKRLMVSLNKVPDILKRMDGRKTTFVGATRSWIKRLWS
ncbi:MAG: UDP-3-O-(3-hydroxymyristoyl)glucosamine N-acyltransferase [Candidatus Babeliales bacterium]|jgi:UDP-3-O-[3-hydroxymyristoyl] glucosamine N-acyltransferase